MELRTPSYFWFHFYIFFITLQIHHVHISLCYHLDSLSYSRLLLSDTIFSPINGYICYSFAQLEDTKATFLARCWNLPDVLIGKCSVVILGGNLRSHPIFRITNETHKLCHSSGFGFSTLCQLPTLRMREMWWQVGISTRGRFVFMPSKQEDAKRKWNLWWDSFMSSHCCNPEKF